MISAKKTSMHKGDSVRVQVWTGEHVNRRVWDAAEGIVYLCTERVFQELEQGREAPSPIGFPISDVVDVSDCGACT